PSIHTVSGPEDSRRYDYEQVRRQSGDATVAAVYSLGLRADRPTALFANHVRKVFFVFAECFNQFLVRKKIQTRGLDGPRAAVRLRIGYGDFQIDMPKVAATVAFGDV